MSSTFLRFLHWASFSVWLGAQLTFMVWVPVSRTAPLETWAHVWKTLAKLQRWVVAPAVVVATLTGLVLTMQLVTRDRDAASGAWLHGMGFLGVVAAILALAVAGPLVTKMGWAADQSLADGVKAPEAETIRRRLAVVGTATGLCVLAAIWFGAMSPAVGAAR